MNPVLPYFTALILGLLHALEPDHMAAVTAFAVRRPAPLAAARFGLRWAFGHGTMVIGAGLLVLLLGLSIPESASWWFDRAAGIVLIILGIWTALHARHLHAHVHRHAVGVEHAHLHSHAFTREHDHEHAATLIGAVHGLAGAAPAIALLQVSRFDSVVHGTAYLLVFAIGTALSMALYALVTGYVVGRAAIASQRWARRLGLFTGVGTIAIGIFWLFR
jgi:ABC-type nickel/cobalt efflux system permease component RcnA